MKLPCVTWTTPPNGVASSFRTRRELVLDTQRAGLEQGANHSIQDFDYGTTPSMGAATIPTTAINDWSSATRYFLPRPLAFARGKATAPFRNHRGNRVRGE